MLCYTMLLFPTMAVFDPFRSSSALFVFLPLSMISIDETNGVVVLRSWWDNVLRTLIGSN